MVVEEDRRELWKDFCLSYHFDEDILWKYVSDGSYQVRGCAIIDVDNTLTTGPTLTENWLSALYKDPKISKESPKINAALKKLRESPWEVKEVFDEIFLRILKKAPLKEKFYKDACVDAAYETRPAPCTRDLIFDLRDRNITRGVMTYGVEDALRPWYHYKISDEPTAQSHLRGTMLMFRNGLLDGYDMGGPYGKASFAPHFVNTLRFSPDQVFAIDDDPVIDRTMAATLGIGLVIWMDKKKKRRELAARGLYKYPGKTPIVLEGVESSMRIITSYVDKWRRARFISETRNPVDIHRLNIAFEDMKNHLESCKNDDAHLGYHMRNLIDAGERVMDIGDPFVATILSGVGNLFSELRLNFHINAEPNQMIEVAEDLCSLLEEQNPELQLTDEHLEELLQTS